MPQFKPMSPVFSPNGMRQSIQYRSTSLPTIPRIEMPRNRHLDLTPPVDIERDSFGYHTEAHMREYILPPRPEVVITPMPKNDWTPVLKPLDPVGRIITKASDRFIDVVPKLYPDNFKLR